MPTEEKIYVLLSLADLQLLDLYKVKAFVCSLPKCLEACLVENQLWKMGFYF
jgi:hypothetical protein